MLVSATEIFVLLLFFSKRKKAICDEDTSKSDAELVPTTWSNAKGGKPDGKPISRSWARMRRIAKVALPFCFVMLVVYVTVYFSGPYPCETANTLSPFMLQVRYFRGPPPVWAGDTASIRKKYRRQGLTGFLTKIDKMSVPIRVGNRDLTIEPATGKAVREFLASARYRIIRLLIFNYLLNSAMRSGRWLADTWMTDFFTACVYLNFFSFIIGLYTKFYRRSVTSGQVIIT